MSSNPAQAIKTDPEVAEAIKTDPEVAQTFKTDPELPAAAALSVKAEHPEGKNF